ncbi:MAG: hypothetical protein U0792_13820 [Gemmataceae bacterium]
MSFIVLPAATAEVIVASAAYDRKPGRYGKAFEAEVDAALIRIAASPQLYPLVEDGVPGREIREYFIERFSQRVIYLIAGDDVVVVSVVHTDRRGAWHGNLPDPPRAHDMLPNLIAERQRPSTDGGSSAIAALASGPSP